MPVSVGAVQHPPVRNLATRGAAGVTGALAATQYPCRPGQDKPIDDARPLSGRYGSGNVITRAGCPGATLSPCCRRGVSSAAWQSWRKIISAVSAAPPLV